MVPVVLGPPASVSRVLPSPFSGPREPEGTCPVSLGQPWAGQWEIRAVSQARLCLPSTWLPVHKVGCRSSGLQGPLTFTALDPEGQGPTVPPGVGPGTGRRLSLAFMGFSCEDWDGDQGSPTPPGLGIRRWPPTPPRALGGQTTLPNLSPWGISRPSQAVWLLLLEKNVFCSHHPRAGGRWDGASGRQGRVGVGGEGKPNRVPAWCLSKPWTLLTPLPRTQKGESPNPHPG